MRYLFEDFALDTDKRELHRGPEAVSVTPQAFDVLLYLIRNRERVVSKDDLISAIWSGRIVSDAALSRFRALFVIARNSSFTYKGKAVDIKQVGQQLGVRYVLEGSVRKAGTRLRITGQLIDAANGGHLWADQFDGTLEDIFDLQDN